MEDGYAFPTSSIDGFTQHGMTLRDWFAGQALAGMMALSEGYDVERAKTGFANYFAEQAYTLADAMLAARTAQTGADHA